MIAPHRIVLATSNPHKVREVEQVLAPLGVELSALDELEPVAEPVEDAQTFIGNARLKASSYARATGLLCLAEDSGLEVDALGGAPGVLSARYAAAEGSRDERDRANNDKLLRALAKVPDSERQARFVCAMCLAAPDGRLLAETRGTYEGVVARAPRGAGGFGYDPLLWLPDVGKTSAELTAHEKNARSHRGAATREMAARIMALDLEASLAGSSMPALPDGLEVYRVSDTWSAESVPRALLRSHSLKVGVWGQIVVEAGSLVYEIEEAEEQEARRLLVAPGWPGVVEPRRLHHVEPDASARFAVRFLRQPAR